MTPRPGGRDDHRADVTARGWPSPNCGRTPLRVDHLSVKRARVGESTRGPSEELWPSPCDRAHRSSPRRTSSQNRRSRSEPRSRTPRRSWRRSKDFLETRSAGGPSAARSPRPSMPEQRLHRSGEYINGERRLARIATVGPMGPASRPALGMWKHNAEMGAVGRYGPPTSTRQKKFRDVAKRDAPRSCRRLATRIQAARRGLRCDGHGPRSRRVRRR